ncbi:MAG: hypothetical protein E7509_00760 [Ruminococcus sp.]|nr:hypothetical protein [Ruminococcus sp.]
MDTYKEQLVKKAYTTNDFLRKTMLVIMALSISGLLIVLAIIMAPQFMLMGMFASGFIIYGAFYFGKDLQIEYEYLYTNGDLDIDKIMGQRKRKRLVSANIKGVTEFARYSESVEFDDEKTIVDASSGFEEEHWYMAFTSKKYGECYLIFTPNEEMLELLIDNLPVAVRANVKR